MLLRGASAADTTSLLLTWLLLTAPCQRHWALHHCGTWINSKKLILTIRAIMISQEVDLVAGDFNGTAWRCRSRNNLSIIDEAFTDCDLPTPPGPPPLWGPGSIPDNWTDVCGFCTPPGSDRYWKVRMHGAFSIPRRTLGLRPTDQSCHHETWLHLDFVDWRNT